MEMKAHATFFYSLAFYKDLKNIVFAGTDYNSKGRLAYNEK